MKTWNWLVVTTMMAALILTACSKEASEATDADNTSRNERDQSAEALTSEDQGGTEADREISANIRK